VKVALSGASGSGKSWVAHYLVERHGFVRASTGDICRAISTILFGNNDKASLNQVSEAIRGIDETIFVRAALRGIRAPRIVLDSVRYLSDIPIVRAAGFQVWRIDCPSRERAVRLAARGQAIQDSDLQHASESELDRGPFDVLVSNFGVAASTVKHQIDHLVEE
jgi:cytidylate kinase